MFRKRKWSKSGRPAQRARGLRPLFHSTGFEALEERKLLTAAAIIAENALPGTSPDVWDISGAGSANIQGYAAEFSIDHGQREDFKIDTDASNYQIDIYRMGYYQGLGARLITTIHPNAALANNQPAPITDFQTGLVDAGNWRVSASWDVPQTAVSGVYIAKLTRLDGTFGESHIIFVVRDDEGHSDLVLQTSDTTWEAYNNYDGSSLYGNNFLPQGRSYAVSYNRPFTTRDRAPSTFFFGAEYPMVRFLEENGYDVSYISGIDTARSGAELLEHKVFISVGHDEYWSDQQRANVEAARDAGVNLAFFSGNEMFWKTRWEPSIDGSSTPYTTLVSYKETHDNAITDPDPGVWTGTWRDPRFSPPEDGGRPENAVTGQLFTVNGDATIGLPMNVSAAQGALRFWRNTSVANLTGTQTATLGQYILGYEWDEDVDNGFRPAGEFHLSSTTANVSSYIQDYGSTYAPGTATNTMSLYRASSGALVFGAGTIQYSWGLDSYHDGPSSPPVPAIQQATVNLFADMGVQPGKLMPSLVAAVMSTDHAAPISTITSPSEGATLQSGVTVTIRGTAQDLGGGHVAGVEVSVDGGATWHLATGLTSWSYSWTPRSSGPTKIMSRAIDDSGNIEAAAGGVSINPQQDPGVYSLWNSATTPSTVDSGDAQAAELGVRFRVDTDGFITGLKYYKASTNTGTHVANLWTNDGTLLASATFTAESGSGWQQVNFATPVPVTAGSTYVASYTAPNGHYSVNRSYFASLGVDNGPLHALAQGTSGSNGIYSYGKGVFPTQTYQASNYWVDVVLNTTLAADKTAPTVTKFGLAGASPIITTTSSFTVSFSEALLAATVNSITVSMVKPDNKLVPTGCCPTPGGWCSGCPLLNAVNNTPIPATVSYDATAKTATITPNSPLDPSTVYTIVVNAGGIKDLAGNALSADTWSSVFTSNQAAPVQSSVFSGSTVPTTADSNDPQSVELGMKFSADTSGVITGARFYKTDANTGTHTATLWSSTGQQLATATFSNETANGWQQVTFSNPVAITAGTTYVISYHANSGHYSLSRPFFSSQFDSGPLHVPANGGVYAYGTSSTFPTLSYQSSNYFVDVLFSSSPVTDTVAPTITNFTPFDNTMGVPTNPTIKVNFSETLDPTTVSTTSVKLLDRGNNAVPATLTYDTTTRTATLTPTSPLGNGMAYTIFVLGGLAGIRDLAGNPMALNTTSTFTTVVGAVIDNTAPTITAFSPTNGAAAVSTSPAVTVTFSEPMNAATVKSSVVYLLKNATTVVPTTLTYNSATMTATLTPTAPLLANTSYTIYVLGGAAGVKDLSNNALGSNATAVFTTAADSQAPAPDTTPPTVSGFNPLGSGVATNSTASISFSEALDPSTVNANTVQLRNAATSAIIPTTISYTGGGTVVTLTPTSPLAGSTQYTIVVQGGTSGVKDVAGNALATNATGSFTTAVAADTTPPTVTAVTPAASATNVAITSTATVTFSEPMNAASITAATVMLQNASNVAISATVSYNAATNTATITPTSALANSATYKIVVKSGAAGVKDAAGNALAADVTASFTTAAPADTTPPTVTSLNPVSGAANVAITSAATVTFSEPMNAASITASTVMLQNASSVAISATVSYNAATNTATITPTSALANSATYKIVVKSGAAGVKDAAGNALAADVTASFTTLAPADTTPPTVTSLSPASGAANIAITSTATVTFSEAMNAASITAAAVMLQNASNVVIPATVSYNAATKIATITPTSALANSTTYKIVVKSGAAGVKDAAGNALVADVTATFSTEAPPVAAPAPVPAPAPVLSSFWPASTVPAIVDSGDGQALDVGTKFTSDVSGTITGLRFYKSAANTGTHTASLWTASGQLLATATFTNETASGWQQVTFATPVAITAGTTYVASYHSNTGHYSVSRNYFTSQFNSGSLHAVANGGVYRYGTGGFPTGTYQGSNYWVDVVLSTTPPVDTTPPTVTATSPASGATNVAITAAATITFSEPVSPATITSSTVFLRNAANVTVAANVTYNVATNTATIAPTSPLANSASYTIVVKGGASGVKDGAGNALTADVLRSFTTVAAPVTPPTTTPVSLWNAAAVPAIVDSGDNLGVELGTKFTADSNGLITGLRFYKSAANTGTHTASLWTASGQLLATATFMGETASGWQTVTFATPVAITAGTTYVASYHTNSGHYSVSRSYFNAAFTSGGLHVPANGGVYLYGAGGFPTSTYQGSNYWVDPLFVSS